MFISCVNGYSGYSRGIAVATRGFEKSVAVVRDLQIRSARLACSETEFGTVGHFPGSNTATHAALRLGWVRESGTGPLLGHLPFPYQSTLPVDIRNLGFPWGSGYDLRPPRMRLFWRFLVALLRTYCDCMSIPVELSRPPARICVATLPQTFPAR
jgi:hypothetical protein